VKHLNRFTNTLESFIPFHKWQECVRKDRDTSKAIRVYIGADLSLNDDFTAVACLYEFPDRTYHTKVQNFIPEDLIDSLARTSKAPLRGWVESGDIISTPGEVIDLSYVHKYIKDLILEINVYAVGYDPHRAKLLIRGLEDELNTYEHGNFNKFVSIAQGFTTISEPTAMFLSLLKGKRLTHEEDPCLSWMVSNLTVVYNSYGNLKPDKTSREKKIDGAAAIINCLFLAIAHENEKEIDISGLIG